MQWNFGDRNPAAHTNVDVVVLQARTRMEIALPMKLALPKFKIERVGARVERAEYEIMVRGFV